MKSFLVLIAVIVLVFYNVEKSEANRYDRKVILYGDHGMRKIRNNYEQKKMPNYDRMKKTSKVKYFSDFNQNNLIYYGPKTRVISKNVLPSLSKPQPKIRRQKFGDAINRKVFKTYIKPKYIMYKKINRNPRAEIRRKYTLEKYHNFRRKSGKVPKSKGQFKKAFSVPESSKLLGFQPTTLSNWNPQADKPIYTIQNNGQYDYQTTSSNIEETLNSQADKPNLSNQNNDSGKNVKLSSESDVDAEYLKLNLPKEPLFQSEEETVSVPRTVYKRRRYRKRKQQTTTEKPDMVVEQPNEDKNEAPETVSPALETPTYLNTDMQKHKQRGNQNEHSRQNNSESAQEDQAVRKTRRQKLRLRYNQNKDKKIGDKLEDQRDIWKLQQSSDLNSKNESQLAEDMYELLKLMRQRRPQLQIQQNDADLYNNFKFQSQRTNMQRPYQIDLASQKDYDQIIEMDPYESMRLQKTKGNGFDQIQSIQDFNADFYRNMKWHPSKLTNTKIAVQRRPVNPKLQNTSPLLYQNEGENGQSDLQQVVNSDLYESLRLQKPNMQKNKNEQQNQTPDENFYANLKLFKQPNFSLDSNMQKPVKEPQIQQSTGGNEFSNYQEIFHYPNPPLQPQRQQQNQNVYQSQVPQQFVNNLYTNTQLQLPVQETPQTQFQSNVEQQAGNQNQQQNLQRPNQNNFPSEQQFGRQEQQFGRQEQQFGRQEQQFGRQEQQFGRQEQQFGKQDPTQSSRLLNYQIGNQLISNQNELFGGNFYGNVQNQQGYQHVPDFKFEINANRLPEGIKNPLFDEVYSNLQKVTGNLQQTVDNLPASSEPHPTDSLFTRYNQQRQQSNRLIVENPTQSTQGAVFEKIQTAERRQMNDVPSGNQQTIEISNQVQNAQIQAKPVYDRCLFSHLQSQPTFNANVQSSIRFSPENSQIQRKSFQNEPSEQKQSTYKMSQENQNKAPVIVHSTSQPIFDLKVLPPINFEPVENLDLQKELQQLTKQAIDANLFDKLKNLAAASNHNQNGIKIEQEVPDLKNAKSYNPEDFFKHLVNLNDQKSYSNFLNFPADYGKIDRTGSNNRQSHNTKENSKILYSQQVDLDSLSTMNTPIEVGKISDFIMPSIQTLSIQPENVPAVVHIASPKSLEQFGFDDILGQNRRSIYPTNSTGWKPMHVIPTPSQSSLLNKSYTNNTIITSDAFKSFINKNSKKLPQPELETKTNKKTDSLPKTPKPVPEENSNNINVPELSAIPALPAIFFASPSKENINHLEQIQTIETLPPVVLPKLMLPAYSGLALYYKHPLKLVDGGSLPIDKDYVNFLNQMYWNNDKMMLKNFLKERYGTSTISNRFGDEYGSFYEGKGWDMATKPVKTMNDYIINSNQQTHDKIKTKSSRRMDKDDINKNNEEEIEINSDNHPMFSDKSLASIDKRVNNKKQRNLRQNDDPAYAVYELDESDLQSEEEEEPENNVNERLFKEKNEQDNQLNNNEYEVIESMEEDGDSDMDGGTT